MSTAKKLIKFLNKKFNRVRDMPELEPEPDYVFKTRAPMLDDWRLNAVRGIKENTLLKEAGPIANRKCWRVGEAFQD